MPYSTLHDDAAKLFEEVYNKALKQYDNNKEKAARVAWSALKGAGYYKDESGNWVKGKSEFAQFSMSIVRASFDKENNLMRWRSVNSDTDPDLYEESMSDELFRDFVDRIENNIPVPEPFKSIVCEDSWCGGMPYLSIAHYKSGTNAKNVPGVVESVYVDGKALKSTGICLDNDFGRAVFYALNKDLYAKKSDGTPEVPLDKRIRISIGFLDLAHKHVLDDGTEKIFERTNLGQICQLCSTGIGRKIYTKGQLVHLALTRVPVNPRTLMEVDKAMTAIITKKDDAESIIGKDLAEELEEKSLAGDVIVIKANDTGPTPMDIPDEMDKCYDPDTDSYDQGCVDKLMMDDMPSMRNEMTAELKSETVEKSITKSEEWGEEPASSYLVVGDPKHPTTWHLPVKKKGKLDTGLMGAAKAALTSNHRGKAYEGPNKKKALAKLRSLYKAQNMDFEEKKSFMEESMAELKKEKKVKPDEIDRFDDEEGTENDASPEEMNQKKAKTSKKPMPMQDEEDMEEADNPKEEKEEKALTSTSEKINAKVLELRSKGITGKAAEKELQPLLNEYAQSIDEALTGKSKSGFTLDDISAAVERAVAPLAQEVAILKAQVTSNPTGGPKQSVSPQPRSLSRLTLEKSQSAQPLRKLSQIEKIARKSAGLPVDE